MLCGSAFKNKGVQPMLDAVVDFLPSPLDVPAIEGTATDGETPLLRKPSASEPFSGLAFKIQTDKHLGKLTYVRVYSGTLESGSQVVNSTKDRKERIGKIYQMHANKREERPAAQAGDIIAVQGLKQTTTGDTLCDPANPVILESMTFPEPVISVAIEPKSKADQEKLGTAIQRLAEEDPTFRVRNDEETGQTVISGMGELHLDILVDRMRREFNVEANVGKPQVAYRETIRRDGREGRVHAQEADRWLRPVRQGDRHARAAAAGRRGRRTSSSTRSPVVASRRSSSRRWTPVPRTPCSTACWPATRWSGVKLTLVDGQYHEVDSSEMAFKIAGSMVLKEAARKADPALLEPMMAVEVVTPEENMGDVIGDLNSRRGMIQAMEERGGARVVRALVPLSEMFGYVSDLRSKTQGRASYSMQFDSYSRGSRRTSRRRSSRRRRASEPASEPGRGHREGLRRAGAQDRTESS